MILAYIDPVGGWLALQALLATLLAIPFLFRRTIARTVRRLRGQPDPDNTDDAGGKGDG